MLSRHLRLLCLVYLFWWPIPTYSQPPGPEITVVYRADTLRPQQARLQGGFWPRGMNRTRPTALRADFSLFNHVQGTSSHTSRDNSGFVSTTASGDFAEQHLLDDLDATGYIYRIHVAENIVDAAASLGPYYPYPDEEEFAAIAGVRWIQVLGWTEYRNGDEMDYVENPDYRSELFDSRRTGGAQPQLAGFPVGHPAWHEDPWRFMADCLSFKKRQLFSECVPRDSALEHGSDYLASATRFDSLKLRVQLANDFYAGTEDAIGVRFGSEKSDISLFNDASRGQTASVDVNLTVVFGQAKVPLQSLSGLLLIQTPVPHPVAADDFKIQGAFGGCREARYLTCAAS
ncbi:heat-labile enterotoxin alpha chain domain-containing protein [Hirsutella rhossiliensis]|uniref:Heat-labile enterotoxin alpha chain domain-containing protein n=1 Tax=Hirsutella rhossiliensis TaxID=111463 RepID=A0A9P8N6R6_9HYPO|nr:heat-labile enterotoxin alpha chain domain-containing protein [Hirsutella rhossiliensis]KAH0967552.1 heat-labile enterotoxin alpha chain domain-containing protein [Hirsutella rhossiliensis]